jgi:hypothetical protein
MTSSGRCRRKEKETGGQNRMAGETPGAGGEKTSLNFLLHRRFAIMELFLSSRGWGGLKRELE